MKKRCWQKGGGNDNISKLSQTTAWKHQAEYETSEKTLKKLKKVLDIGFAVWYDIKVARVKKSADWSLKNEQHIKKAGLLKSLRVLKMHFI